MKSPTKGPAKTVTGTAHGDTATATAHCDDLAKALEAFREHGPLIERWGTELARRLGAGARLLVAGNGGSAAQAQHLTAELVGRYRDDRPPFSAVALHADTSSTTAIANDYGVQEVFARQTAAHGRPGDVLLLMSTSGASANLLAAADRAHRLGMTVWALTGRAPNPLQLGADDTLCVDAPLGATVQELHLVAVHMLCEAFDQAVERGEADHGATGTGTDGRAHAGDARAVDGRRGRDGQPDAEGEPGADGRPGVVGRLVGRARTVGRAAPGAPVAPRKGQT
ncbi:SIS domain-containing protein [Streptomyces sp. NPDC046870]|uniref:D-sedoheptulose-7-phosphate isomerase n=1 Tax=Streptomyces sp. NPDC046870 TaxID=3155135 RepID=UPI0034571FFC